MAVLIHQLPDGSAFIQQQISPWPLVVTDLTRALANVGTTDSIFYHWVEELCLLFSLGLKEGSQGAQAALKHAVLT